MRGQSPSSFSAAAAAVLRYSKAAAAAADEDDAADCCLRSFRDSSGEFGLGFEGETTAAAAERRTAAAIRFLAILSRFILT